MYYRIGKQELGRPARETSTSVSQCCDVISWRVSVISDVKRVYLLHGLLQGTHLL